MNENIKSQANITIEALEAEENKQVKTLKQEASIFNEKNYLNTRLDSEKGELSKDIKIRLLPIDGKSNTPFKTIHIHSVRVPKEISKSGYKNYICLEKTEGIDKEKYGNKCPFCELNRLAYKKSTETTDVTEKSMYQKTSLANLAREACIVRCIERGAEEDGPKFWKFNIKQDKTDPKNVILKLYKTRLEEGREDGVEENILDIYNGRDLQVTIKQSESEHTNSKAPAKTGISIIDCGRNKPLASSQEQIDEWVNDKKMWYDVFAIKPYEYLSIIINGEIPWFDRESGKWISRSESQNEKNAAIDEIDSRISASMEEMSNTTVTGNTTPIEHTESILDSIMVNDDDELPF